MSSVGQGRYRVERRLGSGTTALVLEVSDAQQAGARRALKLLRHDTLEVDQLRAEFVHLSRLSHPSLVRVHDAGRLQAPLEIEGELVAAGAPYLVLDLVDGCSPRAFVLRARSSVTRLARLHRVAVHVAEGLAQLHRHGLWHCDLKPDNVLVNRAQQAVIIDLGLALVDLGPGQLPGPARGTPAFMAPEVLCGAFDHRADLYSLGATLYALATGRPPFDSQDSELLREILEQPAAVAPLQHASWVDGQLRDLILRLLRKDPLQRPASAQALLAELARIAGDHQRVAELSSTPLITRPAFVGQRALLDALDEQLGRFAAGVVTAESPVMIELVGPPGSGKSRVLGEAIRRHQAQVITGRRPALSIQRGTGEPGTADSADPAGASLDDRAMRLVGTLEARARTTPLLLWLDEDPARRPLSRRVAEILASGRDEPDRPPLLVVAEVDHLADDVPESGGVRLTVEPLPPQDVADLIESMVGHRPGPLAAEAIHRLCGGIPRLAVELAAQWATAGLDVDQLTQARTSALDDLLSSRRHSLCCPADRRTLDALAIWGQPADVGTLAALVDLEQSEVLQQLDRLHDIGLVTLGRRGADLLSAAHRAAWLASESDQAWLTTVRLRAAHRIEAEVTAAAPAPGAVARRAALLLAAGDPRGPGLALAAAEQARDSPDPLRALPLLELIAAPASALEPGQRSRARRLLAEAYVGVARYDEALAILAPPLPPELWLLRARTLQLQGSYTSALAAVTDEVLPALSPADPLWLEAQALLGKLRLRQGDASGALAASEAAIEIVERGPEGADLAGPALRACQAGVVEVAGLARYYLGRFTEAGRYFAWGDRALDSSHPASLRARFANLRGMVAFVAGELVAAAAHYRRALELARAGGDVHGSATYVGCVGSTLVDLGRYADALPALLQAVRDLGRLGRSAELVAATCNLANLMLLLGDVDEAQRLHGQAERLEREVDSRQWRGWLARLAGDLARRRGDPDGALGRYAEAAEALARIGDERQRLWVEVQRVELLAELGRFDEAEAALPPVGADSTEPGAIAFGRARLAVACRRAGRPGEDQRALEQALASCCAELERRAARSELWRAALVLAQLLAPRPAARAALERARQTWEEIVDHAPEAYRAQLRADPDARALAEQWQALISAGDSGGEGAARAVDPTDSRRRLPYDERRLRRLLAINKRLNSELDLGRLLELIIDTVIELTDAERGFLILVEPDGSLAVRVARNIARDSLEGEELAVSRSIAEQATRKGEPVVTIDAADDGRFSAALSVSSLRLRSVLAVPLLVKGRAVGTVYVDHRLRPGVFGADEVALMQDLAEQAAIAIDNARLLAENQRRQAEIEQLNSRLTSTVEIQRAELDEAHEELRSSRQALRTRYEYHNIVGRSPRMLELFALLDRVTDTELPVVIQGPSGTGKELVARAIHHNGPRARRAFVSENCGAIPETLLESVLFGHVRGAFTGADRDRRGLFEIADGGTLFLDEVGETSPAMQTKLLRVLQDGELRRIGGERAIRTDVRVVAASNADLRRKVEQGTFREDLFYRLNVISIEMPVLRERREDIPLLVEHFLGKHGRGEGQRVAPAAMNLLAGYPWPGNVRELENEIMRAAALAGLVIGPDDLSPQIQHSAPLSLRDPDDLSLRPRVTHLERELIQCALQRTGGNQSQAARLLGLSRYGLLKKLRRYFPGEIGKQATG